ncbi:hypothetical protein H696_04120 [Fonticula alba]|uniref:Corrinoid adenosyltransferase MMAB n=1 Tax=Fonticula alba TaxID=691883 RepID=A0A058Z703_FONAL|nr:hypothetical protein H696_04120 [Fonticula alba]KCV69713.1 hypothetical protein H696_04120 [Fonticula alba]|eukprot:XP_009496278.1 hypothetical protein H696_04120 [Fonticula alba]
MAGSSVPAGGIGGRHCWLFQAISPKESPQIRRPKELPHAGRRGTSSLYNGTRVSKSDPVFLTMGHVDTLNSSIGVAIQFLTSHKDKKMIADHLVLVQNWLFDLGAHIATPRTSSNPTKINATQFDDDGMLATQLEEWIDDISARLPPLKNFILPSGGYASSHLHMARSYCRMVEPHLVTLVVDRQDCHPSSLAFINRLSDYLFVAARLASQADAVPTATYQKRLLTGAAVQRRRTTTSAPAGGLRFLMLLLLAFCVATFVLGAVLLTTVLTVAPRDMQVDIIAGTMTHPIFLYRLLSLAAGAAVANLPRVLGPLAAMHHGAMQLAGDLVARGPADAVSRLREQAATLPAHGAALARWSAAETAAVAAHARATLPSLLGSTFAEAYTQSYQLAEKAILPSLDSGKQWSVATAAHFAPAVVVRLEQARDQYLAPALAQAGRLVGEADRQVPQVRRAFMASVDFLNDRIGHLIQPPGGTGSKCGTAKPLRHLTPFGN